MFVRFRTYSIFNIISADPMRRSGDITPCTSELSVRRVRCGRLVFSLEEKQLYTTLLDLIHDVFSDFLCDHSSRFVRDLYAQEHFCSCNSSIYERVMQNQIGPVQPSNSWAAERRLALHYAPKGATFRAPAQASAAVSRQPKIVGDGTEARPKISINKRKSQAI